MSKKIKCVVWDLDNTLWTGILSENDNVIIKDNIIEVIKVLDERGILQSISSKNDHDLAIEKLNEFGILEYFLYPQINWHPKSKGINNIAKLLNIGLDTFAFIDDQAFEREEVKYFIPEITCIDSENVIEILDDDIFKPKYLTSDSRKRRLLYKNDIKRNELKEAFIGTEEEFLKSLDMKFTIDEVHNNDLARAEELTVRTHQLNATGYTYSYEELEAFSNNNRYKVLIAQLEDKFGDYGKIGLALIEKQKGKWVLKLLLMSCRVISRGVGTTMLNYIAKKAKEANVDLIAEFVPTNRNRIMYITYKFSGFYNFDKIDNIEILKADFSKVREIPAYIKLVEGDTLKFIN